VPSSQYLVKTSSYLVKTSFKVVCIRYLSSRQATSHRHASAYRGYRDPGATGLSHPFAIIFQMGTLESTKDRSWTWILAAPMETVQKAGVDFNPDTRTVTAIQGDAASGSAFEVIL